MSGYYRRWRPSSGQQHVNQRGKPKRSYATSREAERARIDATYRYGYAFKMYRCRQCGQLHIGKELLDS